MDPIAQIFAQAQGGTAQGQGFGSFFAQGVQASQNQESINLSKRRMQLAEQEQSALLPLQKEAARLNNLQAGLTIETNRKALEQQTSILSRMPALVDLQMRFSQSPEGYTDPTLLQEASRVFTQAPELAGTKAGQELMSNITNARKLEQSFRMLRNFAPPEGMTVQTVNPETGSVSLTQAPKRMLTPEEAQQRAQTLGMEASTMNAEGEVGFARPRAGEIIEVGPDGTTRIARGGAKLPSSTIAKAEDVAVSAPTFLKTGQEIIRLANQNNVGVRGNIKRAWSQIVGQIYPEMAEAGEEFDFAQATTFFKGQATKILRSDSQISEPERKSIVADLPSKGFNESDATAVRKAKGAMKRVADSARRQLMRAGVPLPVELKTPEEIAADTSLSEEQAVELILNSPFNIE